MTVSGLGAALFAPFQDAWLAGRVRLALFASVGNGAREVSVETYHGNVMLAGGVVGTAARETAERAVRALPGVVGVSNHLRVLDASHERLALTDAEIRTRVTARLRRARALRGSIVTIESVYDGVVRLAGAARDARASALAFELAIDVPGVRRVINDLALQNQLAADDDADAA